MFRKDDEPKTGGASAGYAPPVLLLPEPTLAMLMPLGTVIPGSGDPPPFGAIPRGSLDLNQPPMPGAMPPAWRRV